MKVESGNDASAKKEIPKAEGGGLGGANLEGCVVLEKRDVNRVNQALYKGPSLGAKRLKRGRDSSAARDL